MPRFLISRVLDELDQDELNELGSRSRRIIAQEYPEITWEHSHVVTDQAGSLRSFCIYDAPNADVIMAHAERLGQHRIETIYEIGGDISPADFPV
jgi:hypothetical protein